MTAHLFKSMTRNAIAKAFGVSTQTISNWFKKGMPRNRDKTYNLPDCFAWCVDQAKQGTPAEERETDESTKWLTEFRKERAKISKLEREALEKTLLPKSEVEQLWAMRVAEVKGGLYNLLSRLPPVLEGKGQEEMRHLIEAEVRLICETYSRGGEYCHGEDGNKI